MAGSEILRWGDAAAEIGALGAELLSLTIAGRELIWPGDPKLWPRRAPVLFPFCGWVNGRTFRVAGRSYESGVHGFGPEAAFAIDRIANHHLRLTLRDSAETQALFPFAFELVIEVILGAASLRYDFTVRNPGQGALPYALGFHPGFRWPFDGGAREGYRVVFDGAETAQASVTTPGGLFTGETVPPPIRGAEFDILAALARSDSTVLLNASTRAVSFIAPSGRAIRVRMENFPHWVFWSLPPAPYLCIEGWTGQGDPVGFTGDIFEKPGMIHLPPGGEGQHAFEIGFG
jgi:galactose mutarotase-like enzyme